MIDRTQFTEADNILCQLLLMNGKPYLGMLSDVALLTDCTRENVRQRMLKLGIVSYRDTLPESICLMCQTSIPRGHKFCSKECRHDYDAAVNTAYYKCEWCGEVKGVPMKDVRRAERMADSGRGLRWCSKQCQGAWLGEIRHQKPKTFREMLVEGLKNRFNIS